MGHMGKARADCFDTGKGLMRLAGASWLLALLFVFVSCTKQPLVSVTHPFGSLQLVVPEHGAYTGAYIDFGDKEDDVSIENIEGFEKIVGKHQAIVASSS